MLLSINMSQKYRSFEDFVLKFCSFQNFLVVKSNKQQFKHGKSFHKGLLNASNLYVFLFV